MSPTRRLLTLVALGVGMMACSRVPDRASVAELDDQQVQSLCEEFAGNYAIQTYECSFAGVEFEVEWGYDIPVQECVDEWQGPSASCGLLVGDLRGCYDALYGGDDDSICLLDPDLLPRACDPVFDCVETDE